MSKLLIFIHIFSTLAYARSMTMREVPPADNYTYSLKQMALKKKILFDQWLNYDLKEFPFEVGNNKAQKSLLAAIVRLEESQKTIEVDEYLLNPRFKTAKVGTRINLILGLCKKNGDYDFILQYLVRMAYLGKKSLTQLTYQHLINNLYQLRFLNIAKKPKT